MDYINEKRTQNELKRQVDEQQAEQDFVAIAQTPEGRRFLKRLQGVCGVYRSTFTAGEPLSSAYLEGKRSIGLWVQEQFDQRPDLYITYLMEKTHD